MYEYTEYEIEVTAILLAIVCCYSNHSFQYAKLVLFLA